MKSFLIICLGSVLLGLHAQATTYTVKPSGGNYTTPAACAGAAGPGDTCVIYAGSYSGWTQSKSGTEGNLITFIANGGDTVTITGGISLSSRSYVRISGLTINAGITGNGSTSHNQIDHNTFNTSSSAFRINDGLGSGGSDNVFAYNTINSTSTGNMVGLYLFGDRNRIEYNTIIGTDGDCMDLGGENVVVRFNTCKNVSGASSGQHIDFIQVQPTNPIMSYSLIEGNVFRGCTNDGGNCHGLILRSFSPYDAVVGIIFRYNFDQNLDGSGVTSGGGSSDLVTDIAIYNNTFATEKLVSDNGSAVSCWSQGLQYTIVGNNLAYNSQASGKYPFSCDAGSNGAFVFGGDAAWNSSGGHAFSFYNEAGLIADPLFANYPTDGSIQSSSPLRGKGGYVSTAIGSGSSSTALTLTHARAFQSGWADLPGDYICIGSTLTQITALRYNTDATRSGVATLANPVSWSNGANITLAKTTDGAQVANCGTAPDIGAYPYKSEQSANPPAPTELQAQVK